VAATPLGSRRLEEVTGRTLATRMLLVAAVLAFATRGSPARASASVDELVREARAHEAAREDDLAARRYLEALELDPTAAEAYLGLGALRMRLGDAREAERVYAVALEHVPGLRKALEGRARARWSLGRHEEAEGDMEAYALLEGDPMGFRELAEWCGQDGRSPAQLAAWRRVLDLAVKARNPDLAREARRMVRALQVIVSPADPVVAPADADPVRRGMALIARRGG
jgi:tetratricopeptide (TPR) repeat protein